MSLFTDQMKDQRPKKRSNLVAVRKAAAQFGVPIQKTIEDYRREAVALSFDLSGTLRPTKTRRKRGE